MVIALSTFKKLINPYGTNAADLHGVFATRAGVPRISHKAMVIPESIISGAAIVHDHGQIRRKTTVDGGEVQPYAVAMDFVTLGPGSRLEEYSILAHGGVLEEGASIGIHAIGNIVVVVKKGGRLPDGGAALPGVVIPEGVTAPENTILAGRDPVFALSKGQLDPKTLVPIPQKGKGYAYILPLVAEHEVVDGKVEFLIFGSDGRPFAKKTGPRPNNDPDQRPSDHSTFVTLKEKGTKGWMEAVGADVPLHDPVYRDWLNHYVWLQYRKAQGYLSVEAEAYGEIVRYSPAIQAETLNLSRAVSLLESLEQDATELKQLLKANLHLLGVYIATEAELPALESAFENAEHILNATATALGEISQSVTIQAFPKESINSLLLPEGASYEGQQRQALELSKADIVNVAERARSFAGVLKTITGRFENVEPPQKSASNILTTELTEVQNWRNAINTSGIDMTLIPDGVRIKHYYQTIPVIDEDAILVGNTDIGGAVHIDAGAVLISSTVRSEDSGVPFYVGKAIFDHAAGHVAFREGYAGYVSDYCIINEGTWVHGAFLGPYTYVGSSFEKPTVVGDEGFIPEGGIVTPGSVTASQQKDKYTLLDGNFAKDNVIDPSEKFMKWWKTTEFADLHPVNDRDKVNERIKGIYERKKEDALAEQNKMVEKYGEIYRLSPFLQLDILNLKKTLKVLEAADPDGTKDLRKKLSETIEGIEFLLGKRTEISPAASIQLSGIAKNKAGLIADAVQALKAIAKQNTDGVEIEISPSKSDANGKVSFDEIKDDAYKAISPVFNDPVQNANAALVKDPSHKINPQTEAERRIHQHSTVYPEYIELLASQVERVQTHIGKIVALQPRVHEV